MQKKEKIDVKIVICTIIVLAIMQINMALLGHDGVIFTTIAVIIAGLAGAVGVPGTEWLKKAN